MGNCIRALIQKFKRRTEIERTIFLLLVGVDNAGKTMVLNRISGEEDQNVLPTVGFRTISLWYKSYRIKIYDLGGSPQIRGIWSKYYSDIHGVIYVVDASDISRLSENKLVIGELLNHEHISGKPLLLLANKQDLPGAVDEIDLVESLDIERVANMVRCPTRVETCSCLEPITKSNKANSGILNGYRWLLDIIIRNYNVLNARLKEHSYVKIAPRRTPMPTPSRFSIGTRRISNPFKPIQTLLKEKEQSSLVEHICEDSDKKRRKPIKQLLTICNNKTAPLPPESIEMNGIGEPRNVRQENWNSTQIEVITLNPANLESYAVATGFAKPSRPHTAPNFQNNYQLNGVVTIPGQVVR